MSKAATSQNLESSVKKGRLTIIVIAVILILGAGFWLLHRGHRETGPIVIRILGEDSSNLHAMERLKPLFEKELQGRGINVNVIFEPASFEDAGERATQDFKNHTGKY